MRARSGSCSSRSRGTLAAQAAPPRPPRSPARGAQARAGRRHDSRATFSSRWWTKCSRSAARIQEFEPRNTCSPCSGRRFQVERDKPGPDVFVAPGIGKRNALGNDIDGIPQASQRPAGTAGGAGAWGAGHGEGPKAGCGKSPRRSRSRRSWARQDSRDDQDLAGVAEENRTRLLREPAFQRRRCTFQQCLRNSGVMGSQDARLVSVLYTFRGSRSIRPEHPAGGAADAVELGIGWNYRRDAPRLPHALHYVREASQPTSCRSDRSGTLRELDIQHPPSAKGDSIAAARR